MVQITIISLLAASISLRAAFLIFFSSRAVFFSLRAVFLACGLCFLACGLCFWIRACGLCFWAWACGLCLWACGLYLLFFGLHLIKLGGCMLHWLHFGDDNEPIGWAHHGWSFDCGYSDIHGWLSPKLLRALALNPIHIFIEWFGIPNFESYC